MPSLPLENTQPVPSLHPCPGRYCSDVRTRCASFSSCLTHSTGILARSGVAGSFMPQAPPWEARPLETLTWAFSLLSIAVPGSQSNDRHDPRDHCLDLSEINPGRPAPGLCGLADVRILTVGSGNRAMLPPPLSYKWSLISSRTRDCLSA